MPQVVKDVLTVSGLGFANVIVAFPMDLLVDW